MIGLKEAKEIAVKKAGMEPYVCLEFDNEYVFSFPDGSGCNHIVNKRNGMHTTGNAFQMMNNVRKPVGVHHM